MTIEPAWIVAYPEAPAPVGVSMESRPPPPQSPRRRSRGAGGAAGRGQRLGRAARALAVSLLLLALAGGAAAGEGGPERPLRLSVDRAASLVPGAPAELEPYPERLARLAIEGSPIRADAHGRYRFDLGPGRTLALTYRGRFIREGEAADVDRQLHTPGVVLSQQLGDHLTADTGFQWTADIRDPDLTLRTARDRFFAELQGRTSFLGTTHVGYEFVRTDSFDAGGADAREDIHRFVVRQQVVVGDLTPEWKLSLLPRVEGGLAASNTDGTAYDFESVAFAARLDARSGPSLWAQVGLDWLQYNQGPDSQPGDRSDQVTRLAARVRVPLRDNFSVYTDLSWRQDVSTIAEADSSTLRAGAGLELRF